jgi:hypothetical protein
MYTLCIYKSQTNLQIKETIDVKKTRLNLIHMSYHQIGLDRITALGDFSFNLGGYVIIK